MAAAQPFGSPDPTPCLSCRYNVDELVGDYRNWSEAVGKAPASVLVLYASDYGFSDRLSQSLARGVTKAGVAVEMADILSIDQQVRVVVVGCVACCILLL